ncbi:MMPL family transporter [Nocardia asteroides]
MVTLFLGLGAVALALPAVNGLPAGGFDVPTSESMRAEQVLNDRFDAGGMPIVFTVSAEGGVDSPAARERGEAIVAALRASPYAKQIISYWTTPQQQLAEPLAGADRRTGLVIARITGGDKYAPQRARDLATSVPSNADGVTVAAGGPAMAYSDVERQSRLDLIRFEAIATPVTFLALVWIFGSAIAALLPLAVALVATVGTTAVLWQLYKFTDVSVFATNIATAVCLALAVDYTLFIINRYREELAQGATPERALVVTMNTAGRTITYSSVTMALILSAMAVFPQYLLRSLAYGGVTAVLLSLAGALILAPALIVLLGDRIDALDLRRLIRRRSGRAGAVVPEERSKWYRIAMFAARRPVAVVGVCVVVLLALGLPFLGVKLAYPDDRNLPTSTLSRTAGDILRAEFSQNYAGTAQVVFPSGLRSPSTVTDYAIELSRVDGVLRVTGPNGIYEKGKVISAATFDSAMKGDSAYLTVTTDRDPYSDAGKAQLTALKAIPAPAETLFGGMTQRNLDNLHGFTDRIPLVLAIIVAVTLILTFLMTGSFVLPLKVLITNAVSLSAAAGVVVWIFQDGHLGGLGTVVYGHTGVIVPVLLLCIAYALSMDYAVFVLSRIQEEWSRSKGTVADNTRSVALGLARTGRIVTAAAVVMVIVFLGLSAGQVSFMRSLGVGLMVSIIVDAFLVRVFLVPGLMALLGRGNWWAPPAMRRWYERHGWRETHEPAVPVETVPAAKEMVTD